MKITFYQFKNIIKKDYPYKFSDAGISILFFYVNKNEINFEELKNFTEFSMKEINMDMSVGDKFCKNRYSYEVVSVENNIFICKHL